MVGLLSVEAYLLQCDGIVEEAEEASVGLRRLLLQFAEQGPPLLAVVVQAAQRLEAHVRIGRVVVAFQQGVDAALKAPTAMNQQKFFITLEGENVSITASKKPMAFIDLGIVEYNFEVGSGKKVIQG